MQDFLLLIAVAATFLFGFFIMKKLDRFLESSHCAEVSLLQSEESSLRIGFSDPLIADSITDILDSFTVSRQDIPVYFFSGTADELLRELSKHKLDVAFLPESVAVPEGTHYNICICLKNKPVTDWRDKDGTAKAESGSTFTRNP